MDNFLEFLKPSFFKINLALVLFALIGWLVWPIIQTAIGTETISVGFPLATRSVSFASDSIEDLANAESLNMAAAVADLILWYLFSCTVALRFGGEPKAS